MKVLAAILSIGFWFFLYSIPYGHPVYLSVSFSEPEQCDAARAKRMHQGYQVTACRDTDDF